MTVTIERDDLIELRAAARELINNFDYDRDDYADLFGAMERTREVLVNLHAKKETSPD